MTNTDANSSRPGGKAKATFGALYLDLCQHITPPLAGYLLERWPFLGNDLSFEIVVAAQAVIGGLLIKATPTYFVDSIIDAITWTKDAWHRIVAAINKPET